MTVEDEILATLNSMLSIQQGEYNYDQTRYLASKVRAGQASFWKAWLYIPLAAGASTTITVPNPAGYISILHFFQARFSQQASVEATVMKDSALEPWLYVPRGVDVDFNITSILPYDLVMTDHLTVTLDNHDALPQWVVIGEAGSFVRKDVWLKDIAIMNAMAMQFAIPVL